MSDLTFGQFLDYTSKATAWTIVLVFVFGLHKRWWYMGWYVEEQKAEIARLRAKDETWSALLTRLIKPILPRDE
jgi:hypothetical protein